MYTNISKSQDQNCFLMKDKAMISDEYCKGFSTVEEIVTTVRELKSKLFFENKFAEQQLDIAEGNVFKDIQEVLEAAISTMVF